MPLSPGSRLAPASPSSWPLSEELGDPNQVALSRDGRRAAVTVRDVGNADVWGADAGSVILVENWFEEFRKR
jgi:hypothetical protein